jgi:hypothetical protein
MFSELRQKVEKYLGCFRLLHLHLTVDDQYNEEFVEWCRQNDLAYTTVYLPVGDDNWHEQVLTTVKLFNLKRAAESLNLLEGRWDNGAIIGYKIEGKIWKLGDDSYDSVIGDDFCYVELHGFEPSDNRDKLWSFSAKHQKIMFAERIYDRDAMLIYGKSGEEICVMDVWTKDIEAPWKTARVSYQTMYEKLYRDGQLGDGKDEKTVNFKKN